MSPNVKKEISNKSDEKIRKKRRHRPNLETLEGESINVDDYTSILLLSKIVPIKNSDRRIQKGDTKTSNYQSIPKLCQTQVYEVRLLRKWESLSGNTCPLPYVSSPVKT